MTSAMTSAPGRDGGVLVHLLGDDDFAGAAPQLADVLVDVVAGGASVGFLLDLTAAQATAWWEAALDSPHTLTWVARLADDGPIVGVVQLKGSPYPNGRHRAEVVKLLVHRHARGRGVSSALMAALESQALQQGRWLLLLDTETGSLAETLYERWGWQRVGVVDEHAAVPDGELRATTFFSKRLR